MSTSFNGPIRGGTVRDGSATTTGLNVGTVRLQQVKGYNAATDTAATALCVLPAGSFLEGFLIDSIVTAGVTTCQIKIGFGASVAAFVAGESILNLGRIEPALVTAGVSVMGTFCSVDTTLTYLVSGGDTAPATGSGLIRVLYAQEVTVSPSS